MNEQMIKILEREQNEVIKSRYKYIYVNACAGSGKTHTLVKKAINRIEEIKEYQGIIICTFTREAAKEIEKRINHKNNIKKSFVGTIDSFIFREIINCFKNRYLSSINEYKMIDRLIVRYPKDNYSNNLARNHELYAKESDELLNYIDKWKEYFRNGIYEMSFPVYRIAMEMLDLSIVKEYINSKYTDIYIDEAQDLNVFQYEFINKIKNSTNLNILMVGDCTQSIYSFRGAKPYIFDNLKNDGYKEYSLDINIRCHPSIVSVANQLVGKQMDVEYLEKRVFITEIEEFIKNIQGNFFILTETNRKAEDIYNKAKKLGVDVIYSKRMDINNVEYDNYQDIIEEVIMYYYNFNNEIDKLKYSTLDFYNFLIDRYLDKENLEIAQKRFLQETIKKRNLSIGEYIEQIFNVLQLKIDKGVIHEIELKLNNPLYLNYYKKYLNSNRIITIHASKGLQCANVLLVVEEEFRNIDEEYKRKIFVGMTRAVENLYITISQNAKIKKQLETIIYM